MFSGEVVSRPLNAEDAPHLGGAARRLMIALHCLRDGFLRSGAR